jgi:hypothetical protein
VPRSQATVVRMRRVALLLVLLLATALAPASAHAAAAPKVVIIVGPSGDATDHYRRDAAQAAAAAERFTPNVVSIVSPYATWLAVRQALQGASLVIYLGHGNGWPSRYRNELYPTTQNGFGLNLVNDGGDYAHQYFGEAYIRRDIKLAPNAVVVMNHLCYASGNTEPGLPEGTLDQARQRVDNYAAGFIAAGAQAVIADGHFGPTWYVQAILGGRRSIESLWRAAPSSNGGPVLTFASDRNPGFTIRMDPDSARGGYYRSLVTGGELTTSAVIAAAVEVAVDPSVPAAASLARSGVTFGAPSLDAATTTGQAHLAIPYTVVRGGALPAGMEVGARWIPADASVAARISAKKEGVEPHAATVTDGALALDLAAPDQPGRYRLVLTLHDSDGLAYDAETQAMIAPLEVTVVPAPAASPVSRADTEGIARFGGVAD